MRPTSRPAFSAGTPCSISYHARSAVARRRRRVMSAGRARARTLASYGSVWELLVRPRSESLFPIGLRFLPPRATLFLLPFCFVKSGGFGFQHAAGHCWFHCVSLIAEGFSGFGQLPAADSLRVSVSGSPPRALRITLEICVLHEYVGSPTVEWGR